MSYTLHLLDDMLQIAGPPNSPMIKHIAIINYDSAVVSWIEGFHGGFDQTIHVEISSETSGWIEMSSEPLFVQEGPAARNTTITGLLTGTLYHVRLFASNERGNSEMSKVWEFNINGVNMLCFFV